MREIARGGSKWELILRSRIRFLGFFLAFLLFLPAAKAFYLQIHEREALRERASRQSQIA